VKNVDLPPSISLQFGLKKIQYLKPWILILTECNYHLHAGLNSVQYEITSCFIHKVDCVWNVMACAETRFRLSPKRTSPFKAAGASVQSTADSQGVHISGSNAGYTMFRGSVKSTGYPLNLPVSPSLPLPCVTVCHHISIGLYVWFLILFCKMFCSIVRCKFVYFVYLWFIPHPTVFMTHLWIHGMYVIMHVCM
jgi:hypothetical protein